MKAEELIKNISKLLNFSGAEFVLCGSWCMHYYQKILPFKYSLRTMDIDFVFALKTRNLKKVDLGSFLKQEGFSKLAVSDLEVFYVSESLRIDFLIQQKKPREKAMFIEKLGIYAVPLYFIDYLIPEKIEIEGIPLPLPERFYFHKLIVSQKRQNPSKALKDLEQAKAIREVLNQKKLEELKKNKEKSS